ncbi:hypothetical protein ACFYM4_42445, partial [Streptomyces collinus]
MLDVRHRGQVALPIHDGAFSAMDLTARHPRTGELLSTVKFMVQPLAAADELQRDLQRELTYDGLRVAEAKAARVGAAPRWGPLRAPNRSCDHVTVGLVARWSCRGEEGVAAVDRLGRTVVA